ncbi:carbohydrate ABC transporter permease [Ruminiclostridium papyrosolvens]|uniref:ABC transmembrane type-1 domain-containing protein n=1 Tax=Ruminiclostridium papyrosolvens C7 TaxID=1330534 RepID=U4QYB1_9FIRM|nr:sugar ABC transporter permease [Ruminiclostridium papyrosolvens]EPR09602.1 hypothetical protein L323_15600 [Ruminiclostridium papyrosolvens C7]
MNNMFGKFKALPYIFILPAFLLIIVFKIYPIISTLLESLMVKGTFTLDTYETLFKDKIFWKSLWVTMKINIVMIPLQIFIAFCLALLVNTTVKGIGMFRTIFYLPVTISLTVATIVWNLMLSPNGGVINSILGIFGISQQDFLVSKTQALWCIVLIATWKGVGYWMMFILAGLKNVDASIYESAKIDGANWLKTVVSITIPLIKKVLLFVFVANTSINILLFVPMQIVTQGGPEGSTNVLMYEAYKSAFKMADRPRSAAIVTVLLVIIAIVCTLQFRLMSEKKEA